MERQSTGQLIGVAMLGAVLFVPLVVWPSAAFPYVGGKAPSFAALTAVAWVADRPRVRQSAMLWAWSLLLVLMTISNLMSGEGLRGLLGSPERGNGLLLWLGLAVFWLIGSEMDANAWRRWFAAFVAIAVLVGLIAIWQITPSDLAQTSTLGNPGFLGRFVVLGIFVALWLAIENRHWLLVLAPLGCALWISRSRGSVLALTFGLIVACAIAWPRRAAFLLPPLIAVLGALAIVFWPHLSSDPRLVIWPVAAESVVSRPLLGFGVDNWHVLIASNGSWHLVDRAHNVWLDLALTGGLGISVCWAILLNQTWVHLRFLPRSAFAALVGLLVAYFISGLVTFDTISTLIPVVALMSFAESLRRA